MAEEKEAVLDGSEAWLPGPVIVVPPGVDHV